jgi:hypothetical protein
VKDGETGWITEFDAAEAIRRVTQIAVERTLRGRLGSAARHLVNTRYSTTFAERTFGAQIEWVFGSAAIARERTPEAVTA